jgi:hypothetical protein
MTMSAAIWPTLNAGLQLFYLGDLLMIITLLDSANKIRINVFAIFVASASSADNSSHQSNCIFKDQSNCEIV